MINVKRDVPLILLLGILLGLVLGALAVHIGVAHGDTGSGSAALYDAAPAPPDAAVAHAPNLPALPDPSDDSTGFLMASYKWVTSGNGWLALVPFLIGLVWIARHPKTWPLYKSKALQAFLNTKRGAAITVIVVALAGALIHAILATGGALTLAGLKAAGLAGGTGAGWFSLGKALVLNS